MNIVAHSNMTLKETEQTVVVSPVVDSSAAGRHMRHSVSSRQNSHTVRGVWEETIPAWGTWAARGHGTLLSISSTSTPANKDSGTMQPMYACMQVQWSTYFSFMHRCLYNYVHVYSNVDIQLILRIERLSTLQWLDAWAHTLVTLVKLNTRLYQQKSNRVTKTVFILLDPKREWRLYLMYDMVLCSKRVCACIGNACAVLQKSSHMWISTLLEESGHWRKRHK